MLRQPLITKKLSRAIETLTDPTLERPVAELLGKWAEEGETCRAPAPVNRPFFSGPCHREAVPSGQPPTVVGREVRELL